MTYPTKLWLTYCLSEKIVSKAKGHGDDIKDALASLDKALKYFKEEIEVCSQQRFGRMDETLTGELSIKGYQMISCN
jgi:hypothetical protein